jgi:hypothetical protein
MTELSGFGAFPLGGIIIIRWFSLFPNYVEDILCEIFKVLVIDSQYAPTKCVHRPHGVAEMVEEFADLEAFVPICPRNASCF